MELVTKRDMEDAKGLGERSGINMMDDWDYFIHDIAQTIADGRRADPAPWDAAWNRSYEPVETLAAEIYAGFVYDGAGTKPSWTPGGNATKQDEARRAAREKLRSAGHSPQ